MKLRRLKLNRFLKTCNAAISVAFIASEFLLNSKLLKTNVSVNKGCRAIQAFISLIVRYFSE